MTRQHWSALLLSHHPPEEHDHCLEVGGRTICRRCLFLWPLTTLVVGIELSVMLFDGNLELWLPLLALPATIEFVLERTRFLHYHPGRVAAFSLLAALPLGHGLARYLKDAFDPWFWCLVIFCGFPALVAAIWRGYSDLAKQQR